MKIILPSQNSKVEDQYFLPFDFIPIKLLKEVLLHTSYAFNFVCDRDVSGGVHAISSIIIHQKNNVKQKELRGT